MKIIMFPSRVAKYCSVFPPYKKFFPRALPRPKIGTKIQMTIFSKI